METETSDKIEVLIKEAWAALGKNDTVSASKLADLIGKLAISSWYLNMEMAQAELEEVSAAVELLTKPTLDGKKPSVSESEKIAVEKTGNRYGDLKGKSQALEQIVNALKQKINVLEWEFKSTFTGGMQQ